MTPAQTHERLHRLEEMPLRALRHLDRAHTVVMLPVGMVEVHGDHLPLGTDTYAVDALALAASAWLLEGDPKLHVLLLPTIPYGTDPVDRRRPELFQQAGSVSISRETLKSLVTDLAENMVRYGFRAIFPLGFHGGADQSRVLADVCAEMRARHEGLVMFEPVGYVMAGAAMDVTPGLATLLGRPLTAREQVMLQGSIHASMFETSMMLHLRPRLVDPSYKRLRTIEWNQIYNMDNWPGYVGAAPAHADPEIGAVVVRWRGVRAAALIRRAMEGEDLSRLARHPVLDGEQRGGDAGADLQQAELAASVAAAPAAGDPPKTEPPGSVPPHEVPTPPSGALQTRTLNPGKSSGDPGAEPDE